MCVCRWSCSWFVLYELQMCDLELNYWLKYIANIWHYICRWKINYLCIHILMGGGHYFLVCQCIPQLYHRVNIDTHVLLIVLYCFILHRKLLKNLVKCLIAIVKYENGYPVVHLLPRYWRCLWCIFIKVYAIIYDHCIM